MRVRVLAAAATALAAHAATYLSVPTAVGGPVTSVVHAQLSPQPFDRYASDAVDVVLGRVIHTRAMDTARGIVTSEHTIQVLHSVRGRATGSIAVRMIGGRTATQRTIMRGAPTLRAGEDVVLFLCQAPGTDHFGILGLESGTYRVTDLAGRPRVDGRYSQAEDLGVFLDRVARTDWLFAGEEGR